MKTTVKFYGVEGLDTVTVYGAHNLEVLIHGLRVQIPNFDERVPLRAFGLILNMQHLTESPGKFPDDAVVEFIPLAQGDFVAIATFVLAIINAVITVVSGLSTRRVNRRNERAQKRDSASYLFSGAVNTSAQGNIKPLPYGRSRVGSTTIYTAIEGSGVGSDQVFKVQDIVGQGEVLGLTTPNAPLNSVYFDDTPASNYDGAETIERLGTDPQDIVEGYNDIRSLADVNAPIEPGGGEAIHLVPAGFDSALVTIVWPEGQYRIKQSGRNAGQIVKHFSNTLIEVTEDLTGTTGWIEVETFFINELRPSQFAIIRPVFNPAPPGISFLIRLTNNDAVEDPHRVRTRVFQSATHIVNGSFTYPGMAYYSTSAPASAVAGVVPARSYDLLGKLILVPGGGAGGQYNPPVYDPTTGAKTANSFYSAGGWDGTLIRMYSDDPAWIAYDLLTDPDYGLGELIANTPPDIFDFYEASVYNVGLVEDPDGIGGENNRYLFNYQLTTQQNGWAQLQDVLASSQASLYYVGDTIRVFQDRPGDPVTLINQTTIIGDVQYRSNELAGKFTESEIIFNDEKDRFESKTIRQFASAADIAQYGTRRVQIQDLGTTNEAQAIRSARWIIEDAHTNGFVNASFQVGFFHSEVQPGDIIYLADDFLQPANTSGRISEVAPGGLEVTLDRDHNIVAETTMRFINITGGLESRQVNPHATDPRVILLTVQISPQDINTPYVLEVEDIAQYRVLGIVQASPGVYSLTLALHDGGKYARIETGIDIPPDVIPPPEFNIPAPTQGRVLPQARIGDAGVVVGFDLILSWVECQDVNGETIPEVNRYEVKYSGESGNGEVISDNLTHAIEWAEFGDYEFHITGITMAGIRTATLTFLFTFDAPAGVSPLNPPINLGVDFINGGKDLRVTFADNTANDPIIQIPKRYKISIKVGAAANPHRLEWVTVGPEGIGPAGSYIYVYTFDDNYNDFSGAPIRQLFIDVQTEDEFGLLSLPTSGDDTNAAPAAVQQDITVVPGGGVNLVLGEAVEPDLDGYLFETSLSNAPPWAQTDMGKATNYYATDLVVDESFFVRSAPYDLFGKTDLNFSPAEEVTPIDAPVAEFTEYQFEELIIAPMLTVDGDPTDTLRWGHIDDITTAGWVSIVQTGETPVRRVGGLPGLAVYNGTDILYIYYDNTGVDPFIAASTDFFFDRANTWLMGTYTGGTNFTQAHGAELITGDKIAANSITATNIKAETITATQIAADTITATQIAADTITANEIAAGTITADEIDAGYIYVGVIEADQIIGDLVSASSQASSVVDVPSSPAAGVFVTIATYTVGNNTQDDATLVLVPSGVEYRTPVVGKRVQYRIVKDGNPVKTVELLATTQGTANNWNTKIMDYVEVLLEADTASHTYLIQIEHFDPTPGQPSECRVATATVMQLFREGGAFS